MKFRKLTIDNNNKGQFKRKGLDLTEEICKKYLEVYNMKKVAKAFSLHPKTIAKILKENDIKIKGRGYASQKVIHNPFNAKQQKNIDYWIGFIAGDGYLSATKYSIQICSNDLEIINNYKHFIGEGVGITKVQRKNGLHYIAKFSHKEAYMFLISKGLTTKKSLTLKFTIPLNWNILRGLFDADGSFSQNRFKITTGSIELVGQLSCFCQTHNIDFSVNKKSPKSTVYDFYFKGGKPVLKYIYDNMYSYSRYFLTRKKEQIGRHIQ